MVLVLIANKFVILGKFCLSVHSDAQLHAGSLRYLSHGFFILCMTLNPSLCAHCTVRPNKLKCQSLDRRKVYCRVMQRDRWLMPPQKLETPQRVSAKFLFCFGHTHSMQKFLGQGLNLCHSSDNTGSLTERPVMGKLLTKILWMK